MSDTRSRGEIAQQGIVDEFSSSFGLAKDAPERVKRMETVLNLVSTAAEFDSGYAISITRIIARGYPGTELDKLAREKIMELGGRMPRPLPRKSLAQILGLS